MLYKLKILQRQIDRLTVVYEKVKELYIFMTFHCVLFYVYLRRQIDLQYQVLIDITTIA